jgi:hypothetical protein
LKDDVAMQNYAAAMSYFQYCLLLLGLPAA